MSETGKLHRDLSAWESQHAARSSCWSPRLLASNGVSGVFRVSLFSPHPLDHSYADIKQLIPPNTLSRVLVQLTTSKPDLSLSGPPREPDFSQSISPSIRQPPCRVPPSPSPTHNTMPSSSSKSKPKPSEVASEAKRIYIPTIREKYAATWSTCSYIYHQPLLQINFDERPLELSPPVFCEYAAQGRNGGLVLT